LEQRIAEVRDVIKHLASEHCYKVSLQSLS
jgi:hypothetical protein